MSWQTLLLWLALAEGVASAQALDWQTIDSGGGASTGGVYRLAGGLGHLNVGTVSSGTYSVAQGFWGGVGMQPPAAPVLSINQTAATIILSWPVSTVNFRLFENVSLSIGGAWSAVTQSRTTNTGRIFVTIPPSPGSRFYRLRSE